MHPKTGAMEREENIFFKVKKQSFKPKALGFKLKKA